MPGIRYEQLSTTSAGSDNLIYKKKKKCSKLLIQKIFWSLMLISVYFMLSIGLTFYQRWLLKDFHYPLSVVSYHLMVKWVFSAVIRIFIYFYTGIHQLVLPFMTCLRSVGPTGLASGIDVGFSNWALELVTVSLYTMTKSTTIIFILGFAIILGLEKKSLSLVGIVVMISAGLVMFTYKATQFNLMGFFFLILASFAGGLRWTFAQMLMQKSKLGLHNPLDMVYHVQPWMLLALLPFTIGFEGLSCIKFLLELPEDGLTSMVTKISIGAIIAFAMELSEFLVVTYTSSLTLSMAGIFKEMCILVLAVEVVGDQLSAINVSGLILCLIGISGHMIHKLYVINTAANAANPIWISNGDFTDFDDIDKGKNLKLKNTPRRNSVNKNINQDLGKPLLENYQSNDLQASWAGNNRDVSADDDSDHDNSQVLFNLLQHRDNMR